MPTGLGNEVLWLCPTLSNNSNDISGNGHVVSLNGNCSVVAQSGAGGTHAFSSSNYSSDFVSVSNILPGNTVRSISCWVYGNTFGTFQTHKFFASSLFQMKWVGFGNVVVQQYLSASPWSQNYMIRPSSSSVPANGEWHHYCLVQDGVEARGYFDGSLASTTTLDPNVDVTGDSATLELNKMAGYGDDYRLYDRALTETEVTDLASVRGFLGGAGGTHVHRTLLGVG